MKMIRIGLIGYGNWARQAYLPVLREDKENEIVAAAALTHNNLLLPPPPTS